MEDLARPEIDSFLDAELVGRIGCHAEGRTYVVPIIYAYDGEGIYGHSIEGTKLRMMRANPEVCFEVDRYDGAKGWTSVIAQGTFEELDGQASRRALELLAARFDSRRRPRNGDVSSVSFRIRVDEISGRRMRRGA